MANIVPKLNLNKTPQLCDNNSLVFAKNVKLLSDGSIGVDNGFELVDFDENNPAYVGHIVGLNNKVYIFKYDSGVVCIFEYNEITKTFTKINCAWSYSGGKIDGIVTTNNTNDEILTICEYFDYDTPNQIPIKHINLTKLKSGNNSIYSNSTDESIYTQTPNIPITNLYQIDEYTYTIPNGVYQFYVRYKITEHQYTNWFPCSGECFAGVAKDTTTIQGQIRHIDAHKDCPNSFVFSVEHLFSKYFSNYESFQLGFVLSHDDSVIARRWKHFDFTKNNIIYFSYDKNDIEEEDIDEMTKVTFEIFNVKNVTAYKNKLYIANYKETNFNPISQVNLNTAKVTITEKPYAIGSSIRVGNRPLTGASGNRYTQWGYQKIRDLFSDGVYSDVKLTSLDNGSTQSKVTIPISRIVATFKDDKWIFNNGFKTSFYYVSKGESNSSVNGTKMISSFSDNIVNWLSQYGDHTATRMYVHDKNTHPLTNRGFSNKWYWRCGSNHYNDPSGNGWDKFWIYHYGLRKETEADNQWSDILLNSVKEFYPGTIITKIVTGSTVLYGKDVTLSTGGIDFSGKVVSHTIASTNDIASSAIELIKNRITAIDTDGKFYIDSTAITTLTVEYITSTYSVSKSINSDANNDRVATFNANGSCLKHSAVFSVGLKPNSISTTSDTTVVGSRTLMPFTTYEFYLHYVKDNGVTTNGYFIGSDSYNSYPTNSNVNILYPNISGIPKLNGYSSWFVSAVPVKNKVARGFNHSWNNGVHKMDCLECDALLYNLNTNIHIYRNSGNNNFVQVTDKAKYISSGNSDNPDMFGGVGTIVWDSETNDEFNFEELEQVVEVPVNKNTPTGILHIRVKNPAENKDVYKQLNYSIKSGSGYSATKTFLEEIKKEVGDCFTYNIKVNTSDIYSNAMKDTSINVTDLLLEDTKYYRYVKDYFGNVTDIVPVEEYDESVVNVSDLKYQLDISEKTLAETRQERNRLEELLTSKRAIQENTEHAITNAEIQRNKLIEDIKGVYISNCNRLLKQAEFDNNKSQLELLRIKDFIDNDSMGETSMLRKVVTEGTAISNAQLATYLVTNSKFNTNTNSWEYSGNASNTGIDDKNISKSGYIVNGDNPISVLPICKEGSTTDCTKSDAKISDIPVGSADAEKIAHASNKSQIYLHNDIVPDTYYDETQNGVKLNIAIRNIKPSNRIAYDTEVANVTPIISKIINDETVTVNASRLTNLENSIKEFKNNILDIDSDVKNIVKELDTKYTNEVINELTERVDNLRNKIKDVNDNPNNYIQITEKNGTAKALKYDKASTFAISDIIDSLTITVKTKAINGINNINILDAAYESKTIRIVERRHNDNVVTMNIGPIGPIGNLAIYNNTSWNNYGRVFLTNPTVAKTVNNYYWVVIPDDSSNSEYKKLVRITPYCSLETSTFNDSSRMNLPGFICGVKKLNRSYADALYVSGTDVYRKDTTDADTIGLIECEGYIPNRLSNTFYIPSNFNLNCITLREDITDNIRSYSVTETTEDEDGNIDTHVTLKRHQFRAVNSLVCSSIFMLPSMYYDYTKPYYSPIKKEVQTVFDTIVRSSNVNVDESYKNIYTFEAEDYYTMPANRGKIVKLFTLADNIYVHNTHALFKFTGTNTLKSEVGDVTLREGEAFDNGVTSVFDSQYGFGGLNKKHHGVILSDVYIFYDEYTSSIFAYDAQRSTNNIATPIKKIFNKYNPTDILFAADEKNTRVFINLIAQDGNICFSYNVKSLAFISIHDFNFYDAFNTRTNTYFCYMTEISERINYCYALYSLLDYEIIYSNDDKPYLGFNRYGSCTTKSLLTVADENITNNDCMPAVLDIIVNTQYDVVKQIDYINWIASSINANKDNNNFVAEEEYVYDYKGSYIRIYSDQCYTELIDLDNIQNDDRLYNVTNLNDTDTYLKGHSKPRYNCGIWSMNYFRDVKNRTDKFNYNNTVPLDNIRNLRQEDSLVYGKYFVIRFIFHDQHFKLENVSLKMNNYDKVR